MAALTRSTATGEELDEADMLLQKYLRVTTDAILNETALVREFTKICQENSSQSLKRWFDRTLLVLGELDLEALRPLIKLRSSPRLHRVFVSMLTSEMCIKLDMKTFRIDSSRISRIDLALELFSSKLPQPGEGMTQSKHGPFLVPYKDMPTFCPPEKPTFGPEGTEKLPHPEEGNFLTYKSGTTEMKLSYPTMVGNINILEAGEKELTVLIRQAQQQIEDDTDLAKVSESFKQKAKDLRKIIRVCVAQLDKASESAPNAPLTLGI